MQKEQESKKSRPWKKVARFNVFKKADQHRNLINTQPNGEEEAKVHRLYIGDGKWAFFVKSRLKEEFWNESRRKKGKKRKRVRSKNRKREKQSS